MESRFDPEVLARVGHGAIEVGLPEHPPLMVMIAGPIKHWWGPGNWGTPEHVTYQTWRDAVVALVVSEGHLAYCAHTAWRGAWTEVAQAVNDAAVRSSHVLLDLTPDGIPADGTASEVALARESRTVVVPVPPGGADELARLAGLLRAQADAHLHLESLSEQLGDGFRNLVRTATAP